MKVRRKKEEFLAYAQKSPVPDVTSFLKRAEPISEIHIHKIPYQEWRRFILQRSQKVYWLLVMPIAALTQCLAKVCQ